MKAHVERTEHRPDSYDWQSGIKTELQAVEGLLIEAAGSEVQTVLDVSRHLLLAGGKRLRPSLVILSSHACRSSADPDRVTSIAGTVELIHMASLVHDDVIDGSSSRRGRITANTFWGNKTSVLCGDVMLAKAFSYLAKDDDQRIMRVLAETTIRMSESEVLQAMCEHDIDQWRKFYWQIIRNKTAGFLAGCSRCGAILANAPEPVESALEEFGLEIGLAFQLTDDILDLVGDPEITGKPTGSDLREGKFTLPVLLGLDSMSEPDRLWACSLLDRDNLTPEEVESICAAIRATPAVEMARERARGHVDRAVLLLDKLPESPARQSLAILAEQMVGRMN